MLRTLKKWDSAALPRVLRFILIALTAIASVHPSAHAQNLCDKAKLTLPCLDQPQAGDTQITGQARNGMISILVNGSVVSRNVEVQDKKFVVKNIPALAAGDTVDVIYGKGKLMGGIKTLGYQVCQSNSATQCLDVPSVGNIVSGKNAAGGDQVVVTAGGVTVQTVNIPLGAGAFKVAVAPLSQYEEVEIQNGGKTLAGPLIVRASKPTAECNAMVTLPCIVQPVKVGDKGIKGFAAVGASISSVSVDDANKGAAHVEANGSFSFDLSTLTLGQQITVTQAGPAGSAKATVSAASTPTNSTDDTSQSKAIAILIGGWEQAGYSSLAQTGNPFVNIFIKGPSGNLVTGWGRVRLLSAPQPATQGIVSTFLDPVGQLTTQSYNKVGQVLDFVAGPELRLASHWSFIAGFGATTPLSSQDVPVVYAQPPAGSAECTTLVQRFSPKNGYSPGLTPAPSGSMTCLQPPITDIAFANQDRTNFLLKYGAGFRTTFPVPCGPQGSTSTSEPACSTSYRSLDIGIGQDESVTGGLLRGVVFKLDGILPIPTGSASWLYLFGSAYLRLNRNQDLSPLILQTVTGATIPSASVMVLPLRQPNRDYYRLGIGLNISQIFCKISTSSCPNKSATTTTAPTTK
jgi:hypothetical protein